MVYKKLGANKESPLLNKEHWVYYIPQWQRPMRRIACKDGATRRGTLCVEDLRKEDQHQQCGKSPGLNEIPN